MTWGSFVSSLIVAVVVAWLTHYLILNREAKKETRDLNYLALRLAFVLEKFAVDCAGMISDAVLHDDSRGSAGKVHVRLPELGEYPVEADYAMLDQNLLAQALAFRLEIDTGNNAVSFLGEVAHDDDQDGECRNQCARLGLKALNLSQAFTERYELAPFNLNVNLWDFKRVLIDQFERYRKSQLPSSNDNL